MHMRTNTLRITGLLAALLFVGITGCGKETVATVAPVATAIAPTPGATGVPVNQAISASFSEIMSPATITPSTFTLTGPTGPVAGTVAYNPSGSIATFVPNANLAFTTLYTATITTGAANALGVQTASNYMWTFTTGPRPAVISTVPSPGAVGVPVNQVLSATFNQAMNPATITTSTFTLAGPGGAISGTVAYDATGSIATLTPGAPLAYNTLYTATITTGAQNSAAVGLASNYTWSFTTAVLPLNVVTTVPADAATGVAVTQTIAATFNEPLNCTTLTSAAKTFTVTGPGTTPVAGTVTCAGSVAMFTPNANLAYSTLYTETLTTGIAAANGATLGSNFVWSFITAPATGTPTVISTLPANLATNVRVSQAVLATFSEAMTPSTINSTTFTLTGPGTTAVTGVVTYNPSGSAATFTPAASLAYSTLYTATITTGAKGLTGVPLSSNYVWTFTTAATPSATAPTVTSTVPANLATNVPLNQIVSATFSEPMNPANINGNNFMLKAAGGATVSGIVAYAAVGDTLTFTPATNLLASTTYTATITTGVTSLSGSALATAYVWTFTTGTTTNTTPPSLVSTAPISGATGVPLNQSIHGTFNEAMNPLTISTSTFTVTGPGSTAVIGTVSYDAINFIATFNPTANLVAGTQYTASISGATNLKGQPLATTGGVPNPWIFTTGTTLILPPVVLGPTIESFGGFGGGAGMTNQGIYTVINGNIGTTGASTTMTGFYDKSVAAVAGVYPCSYTVTGSNLGLVNGAIDTAPPPPSGACSNEGTATTMSIATQAALEANTAYVTLQGLPLGITLATNELGNRVLATGVYKSTSFYQITTGPLTLDAQGDPNASWVFQMGSYLTVGTPTASESVILVNGAQAKNVFWAVGGLPGAVINYGGGGTMVGTVISQPGITVSSPGVAAVTTINGRVIALHASTTLVNTVINVPAK
jgi:hypothetical protein